MKKLKVGLYGSNGHQVQQLLTDPDQAQAELVAVCGVAEEGANSLPGEPRRYQRYDEFLAHPDMELVCICSPRRREQYQEIRSALLSGKHVYAEKPAVMEEKQLDELLQQASSRNLRFREMCSTAYEPPYAKMRQLVASGMLGEIVQVFVQKSYLYAEWRPQDEDVDGGLLLQVGVHAVRMIEQVALRSVHSISALQTRLGNPKNGGLHMAAGLLLQLEGGAVGTATLNYLNAPGLGVWGNDHLRIFGTNGFMETVDGSGKIRLVVKENSQLIDGASEPLPPHFHMFIREILGLPTPLIPAEQEFQALRSLLNANTTG